MILDETGPHLIRATYEQDDRWGPSLVLEQNGQRIVCPADQTDNLIEMITKFLSWFKPSGEEITR